MVRRAFPLAVVLGLVLAAPASGAGLEAGVGRADLTPRTGYYFMGWVRSDSVARGQHTRLYARTIVLQRGGRKVALVSVDLAAVPNGLLVDALERLKGRGFTERNIVVSGSHTHGGPAGYFNFAAFNTVAPTKDTPTQFEVGSRADPALYTFLTKQLAASIRRADDDLGAARAAWGRERLLGITDNRSIEAHLANHGIHRPFGQGSVALDPKGYEHTIDPEVHVLRVDKVVRRTVRCSARGRARRRGTTRRRAPAFTGGAARRCTRKANRPVGIWSTFSAHGTVNRPSFEVYNADHHGAATRVAEAVMRREGKVPRGQDVVNAYGNTDQGDISAGLDRAGPAAADYVGRAAAKAMLRAWRAAGTKLTGAPVLDHRWTRVCYCGQETKEGRVGDTAIVGVPFLTGSEENRGPLFDITKVPFEGRRNPVDLGVQGHKLPSYTDVGRQMPQAVPLTTVRVADGVIATIPGEMTAQMGRRLRAAVLRASAGTGVSRIVLSGVANEFIQYLTTPLEYDQQHYEGGTMLYGRSAAVLLEERLADLAVRMLGGQPAPPAHPFDPKNGVNDDGPAYGRGAGSATAARQPRATQRLDRAVFEWNGGTQGLDRPVDRPFVRVERRIGGHWRKVTNDLGLQIIWMVDDEGRHTARWEVPLAARADAHRFVVTANRYTLASAPFDVRPAGDLTPRVVSRGGGRALVALDYPQPFGNSDFTYRPRRARGGSAEYTIGGVRRIARSRRDLGVWIEGKLGQPITIPRGALRDRHGNRSARALSFRL